MEAFIFPAMAPFGLSLLVESQQLKRLLGAIGLLGLILAVGIIGASESAGWGFIWPIAIVSFLFIGWYDQGAVDLKCAVIALLYGAAFVSKSILWGGMILIFADFTLSQIVTVGRRSEDVVQGMKLFSWIIISGVLPIFAEVLGLGSTYVSVLAVVAIIFRVSSWPFNMVEETVLENNRDLVWFFLSVSAMGLWKLTGRPMPGLAEGMIFASSIMCLLAPTRAALVLMASAMLTLHPSQPGLIVPALLLTIPSGRAFYLVAPLMGLWGASIFSASTVFADPTLLIGASAVSAFVLARGLFSGRLQKVTSAKEGMILLLCIAPVFLPPSWNFSWESLLNEAGVYFLSAFASGIVLFAVINLKSPKLMRLPGSLSSGWFEARSSKRFGLQRVAFRRTPTNGRDFVGQIQEGLSGEEVLLIYLALLAAFVLFRGAT